jgi:hypothetical protein
MNLLAAHFPTVAAVALAPLEHDTLTGAEIRQLIADAEHQAAVVPICSTRWGLAIAARTSPEIRRTSVAATGSAGSVLCHIQKPRSVDSVGFRRSSRKASPRGGSDLRTATYGGRCAPDGFGLCYRGPNERDVSSWTSQGIRAVCRGRRLLRMRWMALQGRQVGWQRRECVVGRVRQVRQGRGGLVSWKVDSPRNLAEREFS